MKKITKKKINTEYFDFPEKKFKSHVTASKFMLEKTSFEAPTCIYIFQTTSIYDRQLISNSIHSDFVFLKKDICDQLSEGSLSTDATKSLLDEIEKLKQENVSVVIQNGKYPTIFGGNEPVTSSLAKFIFDTGLDARFIMLSGEYFSYPVWSRKQRKCRTVFSQQQVISHRMLLGFNKKEITNYINNFVPSSATVYSYRYPLSIKSNMLADNLESIIYCCPNCNSFFSLYSEFSCLKCKDCNTAIELASDGSILFAKRIKTFDDVEEFLFNSLTKKGFNVNAMISYDNIILNPETTKTKQEEKTAKIDIFADKFTIFSENYQKQCDFLDIDSINLFYNNCVIIEFKNAEKLVLMGKNKENLYILKDLHKLNNL